MCLPATASAQEPAPLRAADFIAFDTDQAALGRQLFYDKILSGNRNISCATCHSASHGSADGLSIGIGEGGTGLGPDRRGGRGAARIRERLPRNAPGLWNLGHKDVRALFHDGRLEVSDLYGNGFDSPAEDYLPQGLNSILAAQALLPLASRFEMAGDPGENEVAGAVQDRIDKGWPILAARVRAIPEYVRQFGIAFDHVETAADITIVEIANAIAAYEGLEFRSFDSPWDAWLREGKPLPAAADRGRELFFGRGGCAQCHSGPLFTDQRYHALNLPAFGPGRTRPYDPKPRDPGRLAATDHLPDAYRFRTPPLRNVALTPPYGHNGAWPTLEAIIRQHLDPHGARAAWTPDLAALPPVPWLAQEDFIIRTDATEMRRQRRNVDIAPRTVTAREIDDLAAFLHALTGHDARTDPPPPPRRVPSGLPVDD